MASRMRWCAATTLLVVWSSVGFSSPPEPGEYRSLNGKFDHTFRESGDYFGSAMISGTEYKGAGVYEQGSDICWAIRGDGSKGKTGNVLLYVDEAQCCLEFRSISDKFAVTKVAVKGTGAGYAICKNQVLRQANDE